MDCSKFKLQCGKLTLAVQLIIIISLLNFNPFDKDSDLSAFEINIRFVGGLLSLYTLTSDRVYIQKAEEVATTLLPW